MSRMLSLMDAQGAGHISNIRGTDSNLGMTIEFVNDSAESVTITSEPGTVIGSKDPRMQTMVITRARSWTVPPRSRQRVTVDALCMEAHKAPPSSDAGEANHSIERMTDDADVRRLLNTLQKVETEISSKVTVEDPESRTFTHTLDSPNLVELASAASHKQPSEAGEPSSQLYDSVVQIPLWQLTDRLPLVEYAKIIRKDQVTTLEELRQNVEVLAYTARLAEILLDEANLSSKQTMRPPEGELEVLYIEHDLLSSDIARLRKQMLTHGVDKESARRHLREQTELLDQKERELAIHPHKDSLIDELLKLPMTNTLAGRTSLLSGMRSDNLQRDEGITRHDLDLIITQLGRFGRDQDGQVLLVNLIDNALPFAQGFETHERLLSLRNEFTSLGSE